MPLQRIMIRIGQSFGGLAMRSVVMMIFAITVVGCAARPATPQAAARRHAANLAAAADSGYRVIARDGRTIYCPTRAPVGSHLETCLSEREWEQEQMSVFNWRVFNAPEPFTVATREGY